MKLTLLAILLSLFPVTQTDAKKLSFATNNFIAYDYGGLNKYTNSVQYRPLRNRNTRRGTVGMILGGACIATGGTLFVLDSNNPNHGGTLQIEGAVLALYGGIYMISAGIQYAIGKGQIRRHPERYSVMGNSHEMGLAYNFR